MVPDLRQAFNRDFTPKKYAAFLAQLDQACGTPIHFRVAETPCFFYKWQLDKFCQYGNELVRQLVGNPAYLEASNLSVPDDYRVPNEPGQPLFIQVDFGLVEDRKHEIHPKLVELQAFPSLYGYQAVLSKQYLESYRLGSKLNYFLSGLDEKSYWHLLRRAVLGEQDPENVILLEIDPLEQKTLPDFLVTERQTGIVTLDIRDVVKQKNRLFYKKGGKLVPIHRIYNRCIVDELVRKRVKPPFDFRDELRVEWAGHPNWYFRISKFSIPYLQHECVPETWFLDKIGKLPKDRENYLLKPLYSFAGSGIIFAPTDAQIDAIPRGKRHNYILQEKMDFTPVIHTPQGLTQAEVRIMYIWPEKEQLLPVLALVRMGRGKMMGVDHNKDLEWVGGSAALWRE